jgi:hypothetical protein
MCSRIIGKTYEFTVTRAVLRQDNKKCSSWQQIRRQRFQREKKNSTTEGAGATAVDEPRTVGDATKQNISAT